MFTSTIPEADVFDQDWQTLDLSKRKLNSLCVYIIIPFLYSLQMWVTGWVIGIYTSVSIFNFNVIDHYVEQGKTQRETIQNILF